MKSIDDVIATTNRRLESVWAETLCAEVTPEYAHGTPLWPYRIFLGRPTTDELQNDIAHISSYAREITAWAQKFELPLCMAPRKRGSVTYSVPSHVTLPSIDDASSITRKGWAHKVTLGRKRVRVLVKLFPTATTSLPRVLKLLDCNNSSDIDFELTCLAAQWFMNNKASGRSPRQVPLPGFHAKWLEAGAHKSLIVALTNIDNLGLTERPQQVNYTYLDPDYLASGKRRRDSWSSDDCGQPAYFPKVIVISENKDTALWFPPIEGGIAIEGDGWKGPSLVSMLDWVQNAASVFYWGDMDCAGLRILNAYRSNGLQVTSLFMDMPAFERYEKFGTRVDAHGKALSGESAANLEHLTDQEQDLYLHLADENWPRVRRIEQERIPLEEARKLALGYC